MLDNIALKSLIRQNAYAQCNSSHIIDSAFALDVQDCFSGSYAGALGSHIYSCPAPHIVDDIVDGGKLWLELINNQANYYIYKDEPIFIKDVANNVCSLIKGSSHVYDLGPGSETAIKLKTLPFLYGFSYLAGYYPLDISNNFVTSAELIVREIFPDATVRGYSLNFQKDPLPLEHTENGVVLYLGSTISNLPGILHLPFSKNRAANREFSRLRTLLGNTGHLILLHDSNQNADEVQHAYDHNEGKSFISNVLYKIKRDLPTHNFDPESFSYKVKWYPDCSLLAHIFVSKRTQSFTINGINYHLEKGQEIFPVNSYKPTVDDISIIARKCGFKNLKTFMCPRNRLALHVLKAV